MLLINTEGTYFKDDKVKVSIFPDLEIDMALVFKS